ncbi:hypothetical protein ABZ357_20155 [Streptomyces sp. NPDC005917]|uniref:hypothetical protein n=1 Tax=unclassified Streptomyces TaxID=2593676 RepID=UPI0033EB2FE1
MHTSKTGDVRGRTLYRNRTHGLAARESLALAHFLYSPGIDQTLLAAPAAAA